MVKNYAKKINNSSLDIGYSKKNSIFAKNKFMKKTYQPFIIEKADLILEVLKDDVNPTEDARNRLCDLLTEKFIIGELSADDPINTIFNEDELLLFINCCIIDNEISHLIEMGLVGSYEDDDNEPFFFLTEEGKKCVEEIRKENLEVDNE